MKVRCLRLCGLRLPKKLIDKANIEKVNLMPAATVQFKKFRGTLTTWKSLFSQAAQFASAIDPEKVISISHSSDGMDGLVTVWYWE